MSNVQNDAELLLGDMLDPSYSHLFRTAILSNISCSIPNCFVSGTEFIATTTGAGLFQLFHFALKNTARSCVL